MWLFVVHHVNCTCEKNPTISNAVLRNILFVNLPEMPPQDSVKTVCRCFFPHCVYSLFNFNFGHFKVNGNTSSEHVAPEFTKTLSNKILILGVHESIQYAPAKYRNMKLYWLFQYSIIIHWQCIVSQRGTVGLVHRSGRIHLMPLSENCFVKFP